MSKRTYEEYIKNDCHPVGYNEPCQSYYFAQSSVDLLLDKIDQLKQQLAEKDKEIEEKMMSFEKRCQEYYKSDEFKRDFAIQELEKVKNYCDKQFNLWENNNFNETYDNTDVSHAYFEIAFIIKEKIKELKGEKE